MMELYNPSARERKRRELQAIPLSKLRILAKQRNVEIRLRSKLNPTQFTNTIHTKRTVVELLLDDMETQGDLEAPSVDPRTKLSGPFRNLIPLIIENGDAGTVLTLLQSIPPLYRLEQQDPHLFWKNMFYLFFPEYQTPHLEQVIGLGKGAYRKLVLWLTWGHRRMISYLHAVKADRGFGGVYVTGDRIDSTRVILDNQILSVRKFAASQGFWKGRFLDMRTDFFDLLGFAKSSTYSLTFETNNAAKMYSKVEARQMDALRRSWVEENISDVLGSSMTMREVVKKEPDVAIDFFGEDEIEFIKDSVPTGAMRFFEFLFQLILTEQFKSLSVDEDIRKVKQMFRGLPKAPMLDQKIFLGQEACIVCDSTKAVNFMCDTCVDTYFCSKLCGDVHLDWHSKKKTREI